METKTHYHCVWVDMEVTDDPDKNSGTWSDKEKSYSQTFTNIT